MPDLFLIILLSISSVFLILGPLLVSEATRQGKNLVQEGNVQKLHDFQKKLERFVNMPVVTLWFFWMKSTLFMEFSRQSEKIGDDEAATDWAMHATHPRFAPIHRMLALQRAAELLKKQGKTEEANQLENDALLLKPERKSTKGVFDSTAKDDAIIERLRAQFLISQGRFTEALQVADTLDTERDAHGRMMATGLRIHALRYMGRYDEAIVEQQRNEGELSGLIEKSRSPFRFSQDSNQATPHQIIESMQVNDILTMIQLCLESGKVGAATEHWGRIPVRVKSTDTARLCNATGAWVTAAQGNAEKSRKLIADALAEKPSLESMASLIDYAVARAYLALHDYEHASQQLLTLIKTNAGKPLVQAEYRTLLGQCYQAQENTEAAQSEYEEVVAAGFEEAAFTAVARTQLARLQANSDITNASQDTMHASMR